MIATDTPVRNELESIKASKKARPNEVKTVTRKLFDDSDSDDVEAMSLHSDGSFEEENDSEILPMPDPNNKQILKTNPGEGEFVLVKFLPKNVNKGKSKGHQKSIFYVGKIIKEIDDDGDCEVSYLRQSLKCHNKFVMPNVPDLKSVSVSDKHMILPKPTVSGTKRQQSQYGFAVNFSLLTLG